VPDLLDLSKEPQHVLDLYGPDVKRPGSYASNCLLARRLCERDVRFVQLFHMGWDHHGGLPKAIKGQCNDTDQATAGLLTDLKQRGLLDDTLVVWGGEFGRTTYSQGALTETNYGRDHHPRCFTVLMAGAGVNKGTTYGETDDFSYNIVKEGVHVHDLNATILHLLSGPRLPPHRHPRRSGQEAAGVSQRLLPSALITHRSAKATAAGGEDGIRT
jgi:hypothetical protein